MSTCKTRSQGYQTVDLPNNTEDINSNQRWSVLMEKLGTVEFEKGRGPDTCVTQVKSLFLYEVS